MAVRLGALLEFFKLGRNFVIQNGHDFVIPGELLLGALLGVMLGLSQGTVPGPCLGMLLGLRIRNPNFVIQNGRNFVIPGGEGHCFESRWV